MYPLDKLSKSTSNYDTVQLPRIYVRGKHNVRDVQAWM